MASKRTKTRRSGSRRPSENYTIKYFAVPDSRQSIWVVQLGTNVRAAGVSTDRAQAAVDAFEKLCGLLLERHQRAAAKLFEARERVRGTGE